MRLLAILLIFGVLYIGSTYIIREYFKVEHLSWWSYNFINDKHKRYDMALRTLSVILIIIGYIVNLSRGIENELWFFQPWSIIFALIILGQFLRAYMEKKYIEDKNYYKASIAEAVALIVILFITYQTNFYGLMI